MTDDGTPIEMSWGFDFEGQQPSIRYSVEPVAHDARSLDDLSNEHAGAHFLLRLAELLPYIDLCWFGHLEKEFVVYGKSSIPDSETHKSRFFAAFDLEGSKINFKAY